MPARLAVNKAAKFTGSGADALSGKKVGVVAGSRHEQMLKAFFPKAAAEGFEGYEPMYDALKKGKVDAILADGLRLPFWVSGSASEGCCALFGGPYMSDRFLGEGLSIMTVDPDNVLVPAFDQALAALFPQRPAGRNIPALFPLRALLERAGHQIGSDARSYLAGAKTSSFRRRRSSAIHTAAAMAVSTMK